MGTFFGVLIEWLYKSGYLCFFEGDGMDTRVWYTFLKLQVSGIWHNRQHWRRFGLFQQASQTAQINRHDGATFFMMLWEWWVALGNLVGLTLILPTLNLNSGSELFPQDKTPINRYKGWLILCICKGVRAWFHFHKMRIVKVGLNTLGSYYFWLCNAR